MMRDAFKAALAATVMTVSGIGAAHAVPSFVNPNFQSTTTTGTFTYSVPIAGWTDASGAGSQTGVAAAYPPGLWDNGTAGALTNVVFFQNQGSALQQSVSGFTVGNSYQISVGANERAATNGVSSGPVGLSIGVNGTEFGGSSVTPVDAYAVYATPWATYTSSTFVATSGTELVQFMNFGIPGSPAFDDVTLLLDNAMIVDVTPSVPEPASLALLAIGLGGALLGRRRMVARQS